MIVIDYTLEVLVKENFYQLLLEYIYFWSEYHGIDEAGKSTKYKATLEDVTKNVQMPKKVFFLSKDEDKNKKSKQSSASQPAAPQKSAEKESIDKEHRQRDSKREVEEETKASSARPKVGEINQDLLRIGIFYRYDPNQSSL